MLLVVLALFIVIILTWLRYYQPSPALPPGPFPVPLFGNLLSLGKLPHLRVAEYAYKHKHKLVRMYFGKYLVVFITDPKVMHEAYVSKWKSFSSRPVLSAMQVAMHSDENCHDLAFANGEIWKRYRKVLAAAFTKSKVKTFQSHLASELAEVDEQFQKIAKAKLPVDMRFYTKRYALNILQKVAFGKGFSYSDDFANEFSAKIIRQIEVLFDLLGPTDYVSDYVPALSFVDVKKKKELRRETDIFLDLIAIIVDEHKRSLDSENPRDVLDAILLEAAHNSDTGFFHEKDILFLAMDLYTAGTDTSSTSLDWFMYFLARFPEYQDRIFEEISKTIGTAEYPSYSSFSKTPLLNGAINEANRMRGVGPFSLPRFSDEDETLAGYFIPKNTIVFWNAWTYNHNIDVWGDPEVFRPERFLEPNAPEIYIFGAGPRMCLGSSLADEEVYQICALLCQRYKWHFDTPQPKELDHGTFAMVLRPNHFKLVLSTR